MTLRWAENPSKEGEPRYAAGTGPFFSNRGLVRSNHRAHRAARRLAARDRDRAYSAMSPKERLRLAKLLLRRAYRGGR